MTLASVRAAHETGIVAALSGGTDIYPDCALPKNAAANWNYHATIMNTRNCTTIDGAAQPWAMLRAYRDGGTEGEHWRYIENGNDDGCLRDWTYYASDGKTVKATVPGRATTQGDGREWCALPVYLPGGVQGYEWDYCPCKRETERPPRERPVH